CAHRQHSRHQRRESASQKYRFWNHRHHSLTWIQVRLHSLHSAHTTLAFRTWRTTQRFCLEGPHATHRSTSLTSHEIGFWFLVSDFFWAARAAARRNNPLYLLSTAHVNQKSFDMTTPNDKSGRCSRLVPAHIVRATRE